MKIYVIEQFDSNIEELTWIPVRYFSSKELAESISVLYINSRVIDLDVEDKTIDTLLLGSGLKAYEVAIHYNGQIKYIKPSSNFTIFPLRAINTEAEVCKPEFKKITHDPVILYLNAESEDNAMNMAQSYRKELLARHKWQPITPGMDVTMWE